MLVLVVEVGASRETAVVKGGESSGLSGAVERSMAVFKSDSPAGVVGEGRGEEEADSSTLSVSSTLMMVAWWVVGGAGGAGGCKFNNYWSCKFLAT